MTEGTGNRTVMARLAHALEGRTLPPAAREHASHLFRRLSSPVRVTLLGKPGAGKSLLLNMLLGRELVPSGTDLATLEVVHGGAERMTVTGPDGRSRSTDCIDLAAAADGTPAFIRVELADPILERISFLEVVTEDDVGELRTALDWAVRRTDIALWCSDGFDDDEASLWSGVPDAMKDHAFLVVTKADILSSESRLTARLAELEDVVAEEFHSMYAVATLQAVKARCGPGAIDEAAFHASGGAALLGEVLRHAERGRRADFDSAHLFLARYRVPEAVGEKPATAPPAEPPQADNVVPISRVPAAPTPEPVQPAPPVLNRDILADAIRFIRRRGDKLAEAVETGDGAAIADVLDQCADAIEYLVDMFSQDETGCDTVDDLIDELTEAADLLVLMRHEKGEGPAADAVTVLLQLKREMESCLAA